MRSSPGKHRSWIFPRDPDFAIKATRVGWACRAAALAPAANLTGVADLVWSGSLTDEQRARFPLGIVGFARYNPDLNADSFLHGSAEYFRALLSRCEPTDSQESTGR